MWIGNALGWKWFGWRLYTHLGGGTQWRRPVVWSGKELRPGHWFYADLLRAESMDRALVHPGISRDTCVAIVDVDGIWTPQNSARYPERIYVVRPHQGDWTKALLLLVALGAFDLMVLVFEGSPARGRKVSIHALRRALAKMPPVPCLFFGVGLHTRRDTWLREVAGAAIPLHERPK